MSAGGHVKSRLLRHKEGKQSTLELRQRRQQSNSLWEGIPVPNRTEAKRVGPVSGASLRQHKLTRRWGSTPAEAVARHGFNGGQQCLRPSSSHQSVEKDQGLVTSSAIQTEESQTSPSLAHVRIPRDVSYEPNACVLGHLHQVCRSGISTREDHGAII